MNVLNGDRQAVATTPEKFVVEERSDGLHISWRWLRAQHVLLFFFCIAWDSFLFVWYRTAFTQGDLNAVTLLFPLAHVAVGIGLTYSTLAGLLNTTRLSARERTLTIRHGPVPWPGNRTVQAWDLERLYCFEKVSKGEDSVTRTWTLRAVLRSGKELDLVSNLPEENHARFLEQKLTRDWLRR